MANLDSRGLIDRIYVGDHLTLLQTIHIRCGPYDFREFFFLSLSLYKSMRAIDPCGKASLDPSGLIGRIYVGDNLTLLHSKYISCEPHGFREEDFFYFFSHYKSLRANDPRGVANLDLKGMLGRIYVRDH